MKVSTDDAARRQEFVWLGPVDSQWPFEASGRAWILAMVLCPVLIVTAFLLAPRPLISAVLPGPAGVLAALVLSAIAGTTVGVLLVRRIGKSVSPTRPMRHHVAVLMAEIEAPRGGAVATHRVDAPAELWIENHPDNRTVRKLIPPNIKD